MGDTFVVADDATPDASGSSTDDIDLTDALTPEQVSELFAAFNDEDWDEVDRLIDSYEQNGVYELAETKAGGADRNRGQAEKLRRYWTVGEGGQKIRWGTPGDWTRCVALVEKHLGPRAKGYCALRHKEMDGYYPGDKRNLPEKGKSMVPANESEAPYHEAKRDVQDDQGVQMMEFKTVGVKGLNVVSEAEGIVEAIVSVTGIVDNVKDRIMPGAYEKTLVARTPKGVWSHDWDKPISKTIGVKELMPLDPELPKTMPNGEPWPVEAGAVKVITQFNLETQRGRDAFADVKFFGVDQEWSIGYNVPTGGAKVDTKQGVRDIYNLDFYEYSPVLFGAMPLARSTSVKEAQLMFKSLMAMSQTDLAAAIEGLTEEKGMMGEHGPDCECKACKAKREVKGGSEDEKPVDPETSDYNEPTEEDDVEEKRLVSADQMILVKKAIETLTELLDVVNGHEVKAEKPEPADDEPDAEPDADYESMEAAVRDILADTDIVDTIAPQAASVDDAISTDDSDALESAVNDLMDMIAANMGNAYDDALKEVAQVLADAIEQIGEQLTDPGEADETPEAPADKPSEAKVDADSFQSEVKSFLDALK